MAIQQTPVVPQPTEAEQKQAASQMALLNTPVSDMEEALGEVSRERELRDRCYPRWVSEGKLSKIDAKDRLRRIIYAEKLLILALDSVPHAE
jgi:hypothetical protein